MPRTLLSTIVLLGAALLAAPRAHAAPAAELGELRDKALLAVRGDAAALERSKAVADLAALDTPEASKALLECLTAFAERTAQIEKDNAAARKLYNERYAGFTLNEKTDPGAWETKRRLLDQLETQDERLQSDAIVAQVFVASIAKLKNTQAVTACERAVASAESVYARRVLWSGLLINPATKAAELAKKGMRDEDPLVRLALLEAMQQRKDPTLVEPAAKALSESGWPLRRAAILALVAQEDLRAVPALVSAMGVEDGALLEDYAAALSKLTGANLGTFYEPWKRWLEDHKAEFAEKGVKPAPAPVGGGKPAASKLHYYGIETPSKKVLFILDISGSMKEPIGVDSGPVTGVKRDEFTGPKIEIAKRVLADAIRKLPKECTFNVIVFNHAVRVLSEKMMPATDENKAKINLEVEELQPSGSTWTYGALRKAFEMAQSTCTYEKFDPCVDTIFLLSDGAPTDDSIDEAKPMEPKKILDAVDDWNLKMKINIHSIAIDPRIGKGNFVRFMKDLAARNRGLYREIGAK